MADAGWACPVRRATAADALAVRALFCATFAATFGHLYPPHELADWLAECSPAMFHAECTSAAFACFVGYDADGRLGGYATAGHQDLGIETEGRWWVLRQLYLDAAARGTGLAARLMDHVLAEARARAVDNLYLTVWVNNHRARRFYGRYGFVEVGRYAFRVGGTVDDDRILKLAL